VAESKNSQDGKERLYELAVAALLSESSIEAAAQLVGITGRTLQTWLTRPEFLALWAEAKRTVVQSATARLRSAMGKAVTALEDVLDNTETPAAVRVSAARTILEMAFRSHEIEDLGERIAILERTKKP
jgi:malonyl CoA-acyl carrier protein transacylase